MRILGLIGRHLASVAINNYGIRVVEKLIRNIQPSDIASLTLVKQAVGPFIVPLLADEVGTIAILYVSSSAISGNTGSKSR